MRTLLSIALAGSILVGATTCAPLGLAETRKAGQTGYLADELRQRGFLSGGASATKDHARKQWDHVASTDGAACRAALKASGTKFRDMPDRKDPDQKGCGIPHGVIVTKGPSGISYQPPLAIDCSLALALAGVEKVIQEEAKAQLGSEIVKIASLGTYSCRNIRGWKERISQHALGNAMDLASFFPKKGKAATVLRDYPKQGVDPITAQGRFMRRIFQRFWRETQVTRVLGPDWDAAHRDHFHLDRGLRGGW